jgi:hypothetical protein
MILVVSLLGFEPLFLTHLFEDQPIPEAAQSKALVYGRSPSEIEVSNPAVGMDVCLSRVLFVVR